LEQFGLPNPRTFELIDGKFESAGGSRMEGLDEDAVEGMIRLRGSLRMIMNVSLGGRRMRRLVGSGGMGCIAGIKDVSAKKVTLPCHLAA
jgi:hypothetical protein